MKHFRRHNKVKVIKLFMMGKLFEEFTVLKCAKIAENSITKLILISTKNEKYSNTNFEPNIVHIHQSLTKNCKIILATPRLINSP